MASNLPGSLSFASTATKLISNIAINGTKRDPIQSVNKSTSDPSQVEYTTYKLPDPNAAPMNNSDQVINGYSTSPITGVMETESGLKFTTSNEPKPEVVKDMFLNQSTQMINHLREEAIKNYPNTKDNAESIKTLNATKDWRAGAINNVLHRSINATPKWKGEATNHAVYEFFDRYYSIYPDVELTNLCHYVFMTRPDLNILEMVGNRLAISQECSSNNTFKMLFKTQPWVLTNLSSLMTDKHDFMPIATSRIESIQLADYSLNTGTINQPYTGLTLPYSSHAIRSTTGGSFDITFREFGDLSLHKLFQVWMEYIDGITRNKWSPRDIYITHNQADYMISVYDIICAPDAKTILYWVKYTGVFPTVNPNSSLSFNLRDKSADNHLSISFQYYLTEPLKPELLSDFNINSKVLGNTINYAADIPDTVSPDIPFASYGTGYGMVEKPFISKNEKSGFYELRWVPRTTFKI